ncbi:hypothetical protein Ahy_A10g046896 [Arachis hypogaea]|uniref:Uncharacterized protein n=1 Tax=Arachis hypogaea TaxID=3818 RepID=A0A445B0U2_ARAHY|nr:hypothetical protein Ahy_A10g046896 [Arachis hypogaea]
MHLSDSTTSAPSHATLSGTGGVCLMRNVCKGEQYPSVINFISTFLSANSFRLNFVPIAPDFIFNCGGLSVAFVFVTNWGCNNVSLIFSRIHLELSQAIGSVQAIAKASKDQILENTDLSAEKAEMISRFLRDPKLYSSPKIT